MVSHAASSPVATYAAVHWGRCSREWRNTPGLDRTHGNDRIYQPLGRAYQARELDPCMHLRGQTYAFYKSCPEQQRKSYSALKDELTKRLHQCDCVLSRVVCFMTGSNDTLGRRWMPMPRTCVICSIWPILKPNKGLKRQRTWDEVCSHTSLWQDCDRTFRSSWLEWTEHFSSCWQKPDSKKPSCVSFLRGCLDHYHHYVSLPLC